MVVFVDAITINSEVVLQKHQFTTLQHTRQQTYVILDASGATVVPSAGATDTASVAELIMEDIVCEYNIIYMRHHPKAMALKQNRPR